MYILCVCAAHEAVCICVLHKKLCVYATHVSSVVSALPWNTRVQGLPPNLEKFQATFQPFMSNKTSIIVTRCLLRLSKANISIQKQWYLKIEIYSNYQIESELRKLITDVPYQMDYSNWPWITGHHRSLVSECSFSIVNYCIADLMELHLKYQS